MASNYQEIIASFKAKGILSPANVKTKSLSSVAPEPLVSVVPIGSVAHVPAPGSVPVEELEKELEIEGLAASIVVPQFETILAKLARVKKIMAVGLGELEQLEDAVKTALETAKSYLPPATEGAES